MSENTSITKTVESDKDIKDFLSTLISSKKLPSHIKSVEEAFTIAQMGKELGFATMQAFHYIIPIQGKLSLSAKATGALLRKGGVKFITIEDGIWIYKNNSLSPTEPDERPIERRTTIKFFRDGMEESCSFTWGDAKLQGLTTKDNWTRMPKEMLYARCLAKGANRIGADLLLGLYTTEELADTFIQNESQIKRNEDGTIAEIIDVLHQEVK
tara:strand:+ start:147 stop:782 length:636 start_codon:yes stop_codon:yes gene_type:complete